ncbi:MAG: serine--tRNA ligase [Myxococcales bacterium]|nr:serine--tRNA ligase [Myxococcota bacterium]MDW8282779.1 serine--tRNA ligase [Myxococcales bacterium]
MLDLRLLRDHAAEVAAAYRDRLFDEEAVALLERVREADSRRRQLLAAAEELKARRNAASQTIGREKDPERRAALIREMEAVKQDIAALDEQLRAAEAEVTELALQLPNLPDEHVPTGRSEADNVVVRTEGKPIELPFPPRPHWEIGERLGIIDFERGAKISGSRFYVLRGAGAALQRALINWMIDVHLRQGYTEVYPPYMVRRDCLVGTAQLPKFGDNLYRDAEEDFYFIPTAEVPVTNLYRDEILDGTLLPIKHVAYSACFRREKMAAGRDTRGIKRGHQFDKVEMVKFVRPETSRDELLSLVQDAEEVLRLLGLPYRVVQMCTGDLSFSACEKYDLEVWAPGCGEWLEVSSCSNFGDFQARRAQIRYRPDGNKKEKPRLVHTLNGSGLALPRTLIAVLETYQQADGSVRVPEVLRPYLGGREIL